MTTKFPKMKQRQKRKRQVITDEIVGIALKLSPDARLFYRAGIEKGIIIGKEQQKKEDIKEIQERRDFWMAEARKEVLEDVKEIIDKEPINLELWVHSQLEELKKNDDGKQDKV